MRLVGNKASKICSTALATLVCGFLASNASALTMTQSQSFTSANSATLFFDGFTSSLGTLTGVTANLSGTATIAAGEISGTTDEYDVFSGYITGVTRVLGNTIFLYNRAYGPNILCLGDPFCTDAYLSDTEDLSDTLIRSNLEPFIDNGFMLFMTLETEFLSSSGKALGPPSTSWLSTGSVEITYTYDAPANPVPLPAGLPLFLAGLGAMVAARRRRT
jgi:hypothetical protein